MNITNHFNVFDIQPSIILNREILESRYIKKQIEFFNDEPKQNQINQSYKLLCNDIMRLEHIFELNNLRLSNHIDQANLIEFYELNEEIESLGSKSKTQKISKIKLQVKNLLIEIDNVFLILDTQIINDLMVKIKYLNRIIENHSNKLKNLQNNVLFNNK